MKKPYTAGLVNAGAVTLEQAHMQPQSGPGGLQRAPAAEQQLWTYLAQLAAALRAAHVAGCAVGAAGLAPSKLLLTSRVTARIKIGAALLQNIQTTCTLIGSGLCVVLDISRKWHPASALRLHCGTQKAMHVRVTFSHCVCSSDVYRQTVCTVY